MPGKTTEPEQGRSDATDGVGSSEPNESATPDEDAASEPIKSIGQLIELSEELALARTSDGIPVYWVFRGVLRPGGV